MAERFKADGFAGEITIDSVGTGGGFERFCKTGETDISNASRPIKDEEAENCKAVWRHRRPALIEHDIELGHPERRGDLVLYHTHACAVADRILAGL